MKSNISLKVICAYFLIAIGSATARNISFSIMEPEKINYITVNFSESVDTQWLVERY